MQKGGSPMETMSCEQARTLFDKKIERGTVVVSGDNKISFNPKID